MGKNRVCLITLDGVGVGAAPDAAVYGDAGADTLGHIFDKKGELSIPNLLSLGLGRILGNARQRATPSGAYGKMEEVSAGKDTTSGHWEIAGIVTRVPFPVFPNGFPDDILSQIERRNGRKFLGNYPASGTVIINELGPQHQATGMPIVYTSADSVFQIAAHEETIPIEDLYHICRVAREILTGDRAVARVIARPFNGQPGHYTRTDRRRDFSLPPPSPTILDSIRDAGLEAIGIGKIEDIFAGQGLTRSTHTHDNEDGIRATIEELRRPSSGIVFLNLVDFDSKYGHRRDVDGFAEALEKFDHHLPRLLSAMHDHDTLIITADHGNDPTYRGTDHTREMVPVLACGRGILPGHDLGVRKTFADVAATVADLLHVRGTGAGSSFASL